MLAILFPLWYISYSIPYIAFPWIMRAIYFRIHFFKCIYYCLSWVLFIPRS